MRNIFKIFSRKSTKSIPVQIQTKEEVSVGELTTINDNDKGSLVKHNDKGSLVKEKYYYEVNNPEEYDSETEREEERKGRSYTVVEEEYNSGEISRGHGRGRVSASRGHGRNRNGMANYSESLLMNAKLDEAIVSDIDLSGSTMMNGKIRGAYFENVDMSNVNLMNADLRDTELHNVNLSRSNLMNADLSGVVFTGSGGPSIEEETREVYIDDYDNDYRRSERRARQLEMRKSRRRESIEPRTEERTERTERRTRQILVEDNNWRDDSRRLSEPTNNQKRLTNNDQKRLINSNRNSTNSNYNDALLKFIGENINK